MADIVIGVDPDSDRHGVAFYEGGVLKDLQMMDTPVLIGYITRRQCIMDQVRESILLSIENVKVNQFVYSRNKQSSKAAESKIAMYIGRNQQAQIELEKWLAHYDIPYVLHPPQKGNWAKNKAQFEKVTGWQDKSNEDTRSAAFFGYLAINQPDT